MNSNTIKARAGALGAGVTGPAAGFAILFAINEVIPDAPWLARAFLFCLVSAVIGYWQVYRAPANQQPVSVNRFGAVGDGETDDTAAFQAAVDEAESSKGAIAEVRVPRGGEA